MSEIFEFDRSTSGLCRQVWAAQRAVAVKVARICMAEKKVMSFISTFSPHCKKYLYHIMKIAVCKNIIQSACA
jgi:hypothetical protein